MLSRLDREELEELNVSQEILDLKKGMGVMNIALFGLILEMMLIRILVQMQ